MLRLRLLLVSVVFLAFPVSSYGQTSAWAEAGGELWTLNLPGGEMLSVGPTGLATRLSALARTPDGRLFGLADPGPASELYELDTTSGAASLVVTLDLSGADGLAVLDDGRVFVNAGADIYELDPGDGSTTLLVSLAGTVTALGDDGVMLLALVDASTPQLFRVAPSDSGTSLINGSLELQVGRAGIAVDPGGNVWTLTLGGGTLAYVSFVPQRIDAFGAGDVTSYDSFAYFFGTPQAALSSLAWQGPTLPTDIPGPGTLGQSLLALLLVAAGWLVLLRRG